VKVVLIGAEVRQVDAFCSCQEQKKNDRCQPEKDQFCFHQEPRSEGLNFGLVDGPATDVERDA
jgi:hypothetical protein